MMVLKKILFVCIENSCRSQMAEGLMRCFGSDVFEAYSAGSKPSGKVNLNAIVVMKEMGIDISQQKSKSFGDLPASTFDYVVTMGCKDVCPLVPGFYHMEWMIDDPKGKSIVYFRKTRDTIKEKVISLVETVKKTRK